MIGLDTNVVVRCPVRDAPVQSVRAAEILQQRLPERGPGFISLVAAALD
jgi:predicted nucleic-acid-binding protein